ncbi:MAG: SPFH domain-containing protein [Planctomycetes bacterium]|nr:SPFH domain-containing protein [Planctomycetota bacterium]
MNQTHSKEIAYRDPRPGVPMLLLGLALVPAAIGSFIVAGNVRDGAPVFGILGLLALLASLLVLRGLTLVNPNQSKVVLLFGNYRGSIREPGLYWVNPFTIRKHVSQRAHNFNSEKLKVNDQTGNPIEIGAVVVWRVRDTAQATFDVENFESYVEVQTESALRTLAANHPYDATEDHPGVTSLRGSADVVAKELMHELTERLSMAGIEVLEARLAHLAYAPEIAGAMLQRQQAQAIIAARTKIVDGAVGMVEMALERLSQRGVVQLDEERKAAMVQNLMVVLCSERGSQPIVNAGSMYP